MSKWAWNFKASRFYGCRAFLIIYPETSRKLNSAYDTCCQLVPLLKSPRKSAAILFLRDGGLTSTLISRYGCGLAYYVNRPTIMHSNAPTLVSGKAISMSSPYSLWEQVKTVEFGVPDMMRLTGQTVSSRAE